MPDIVTFPAAQTADCFQIRRIRNYAWFITVGWTLLLLASAVLSYNGDKEALSNLALTEARTAIDRDILYRSWGSSHGGVYAPVSEKNSPNPYLSHLPERDIHTPSGRKLTLINPAYMTRQVYELAKGNNAFTYTGHLTSLNPIRPENAPDAWEKRALHAFEKGNREINELIQIDGQPFMRLIRAFVTEKSCLKCHADQGYKEGDIRGGLSVIMAVQPLKNAYRKHTLDSMATHVLVWLLGLCLTVLGAQQLIRTARAQKQTETKLQAQTLRLEQEIAERQGIQEALQNSEEKLVVQNDELQATGEILRVQLDEYEISQRLLKESNSNLQAIFEVSPLPIFISSYNDGTIKTINGTFSDAFGYQRDEIIGKTSIELGIWTDLSERRHFIRFINEQHGISGYPAEMKNNRGEVRSIRLFSTAIDYTNERCLLIVIMDVTDQKRLENELRQAQKMDVVGQLAGGVAHDFNNMLTAIIGSAEMMERYVKDHPAQAKLLKTIQEAARRSAVLTAQLLAFSRKGNKLTVQIWINKTIQSVIDILERTIDKSIRLETRLTAKFDLVIGDPSQLQNALLNLGINARDALKNGGVITYATATVFLDTAYCESHGTHLHAGNYLEISVSDTGIGIKKEDLEHIFDPFFTTKEIGKGAGLGLAAVYSIVKEHRGSINVFSEPGTGTVFKLYLPLADEQQIGTISPHLTRNASGGVLLVDDEQLIRETGKALLEDHGFQVFLAEDGRQALEVYDREREHISLVIMDVVMPVMSGKDALKLLSSTYPDIKVLISSGFHQDENYDTFIKLGAVGFIRKPYRSQELFKAVDEAIEAL